VTHRTNSGLLAATALLVAALVSAGVAAQPPGAADTRSPRERALFDLTGQWVAVVTEDWRWRMVTPQIGDTASVPLNPRGRTAAAEWSLERDRAEGSLCKAFGLPGLMRQPTRVRIDWEDDDTLELQFDAGRQVRKLEFAPVAVAAPSLQGHSEARWFRQTQSRGVFGARTPPGGGTLVVRTTQLTEGYLRPNGVPYSAGATVKEYFTTFTLPGDGGTWLVVTMVVDDPQYLTTEMLVSSQFKKETSRGGWNPRPCDIAAPLVSGVAPQRGGLEF
jgi:hypothetical protein